MVAENHLYYSIFLQSRQVNLRAKHSLSEYAPYRACSGDNRPCILYKAPWRSSKQVGIFRAGETADCARRTVRSTSNLSRASQLTGLTW